MAPPKTRALANLENLARKHSGKGLRVLHPVQAGCDTVRPLVHAVKLAFASRGSIEIVDLRGKKNHGEGVSVRGVLMEWGILPAGASRSAVEEAGLKVTKMVTGGNAKKKIGERLDRHDYDLIVLGTTDSRGIASVFDGNLVDFLSHSRRQTSLYIPQTASPFVDETTGHISLKTILIPVADRPSVEPCFAFLQSLLKISPLIDPQIIGMHAGNQFPFVSAPLLDGLQWKEQLRSGPIASSIIAAAHEFSADLIIMATTGRDSLTERFIGSQTEQVLRQSPCPVLAVPSI